MSCVASLVVSCVAESQTIFWLLRRWRRCSLDSVLRQTNEYSSGEGRRNLGERNKDGTFVGMWKIAHVWNTSNTSYNETAPAHAQVNATEHLSIMADDEDEISGWS